MVIIRIYVHFCELHSFPKASFWYPHLHHIIWILEDYVVVIFVAIASQITPCPMYNYSFHKKHLANHTSCTVLWATCWVNITHITPSNMCIYLRCAYLVDLCSGHVYRSHMQVSYLLHFLHKSVAALLQHAHVLFALAKVTSKYFLFTGSIHHYVQWAEMIYWSIFCLLNAVREIQEWKQQYYTLKFVRNVLVAFMPSLATMFASISLAHLFQTI